MVISSQSRESLPIASFARGIDHAIKSPIFLLVMHTDDFARMAWRHGRRAAQLLERKTSQDLTSIAGRVPLDEDALVHEPASDVYAVALFDPAHGVGDSKCDGDRRSRAAMERAFSTARA